MTHTGLLSNTVSPDIEDGSRSTPTDFANATLFDWLYTATAAEIDTLPFGVVVMTLDGIVKHYNIAEGKLAGLTPARVIGRNFFTSVAPCTNNFMVAERFATEPDMDAIIDYVFTLRMTPKKVRLRLMRRPTSLQMFLIVERRV